MSNSMIIQRDSLKEILHQIQESLNKRYDNSEPSNMLTLLEELSYLLGNSTLAQASSRFWLEEKRKVEIKKYIDENPVAKDRLNPLMLKDYINSCCAAEMAAYELSERQHSSLKARIEALRSALSFLKAEIQNINQGV